MIGGSRAAIGPRRVAIGIVLCGALLAAARPAAALGERAYISVRPVNGAVPIVRAGAAAGVRIDPGDWPGVLRAAEDLRGDIARVTGVTPPLSRAGASSGPYAIVIGTAGRSAAIDDLARRGKIDIASLAGKWESFF